VAGVAVVIGVTAVIGGAVDRAHGHIVTDVSRMGLSGGVALIVVVHSGSIVLLRAALWSDGQDRSGRL
jgi:hypothetical protein